MATVSLTQRAAADAVDALSRTSLAVNGYFWPMPHVGSGQYLHQLLPALADLSPAGDRALMVMADVDTPPRGARVVAWRSPVSSGILGDAAKTWFEQVAFPRRAAQADLAFVPYFAPPLNPTVPTVVTVHDLIPLALPAYRGSPLARAYFRLAQAALPRAAHIITDSEFSRRDILLRFSISPDRVTAIPLAPAARFRPADSHAIAAVRARYGLPQAFILYMGGYDVRKEIGTLLTAYAHLRASGYDVPLVCAGGLPNDSEVTPDPRRQAATLGLTDVLFPGRIPAEDQPALLSAATVFVFPSRYEGFGLPPLEAMACGAPTIVANATSLPEVVGDAALLFAALDRDALAETLRRALDDADLRADLRRRGLQQAARFTWATTAAQTQAVFARALVERYSTHR